ncbi:MAG: DNA ligase (NAD(+)) LigA, partial [Spirochaetales bacterium]|nr:DNA ligase (NAD(+)) LigA [Spirochaetales bacterium]
CPNHDCPAQVKGRLAFFCAKGQMDIEGLGPKTIETLYENGFVRSISELYSFDFNNLKALEDFGGAEGKKIEGMKMALEKSRRTPFRSVLVSLGIAEFGKKAVDLVCDAGYDSMDKLLAIADSHDVSSLSAIKGIGEVTANLIIDGLNSEDIRVLINDLRESGLQMQDEKDDGPALEQIFKGQSWCVTGSFENFNPRSKAMDEIKRRGGVEVSGVSRKTTCLLAGSGAGSKIEKAREFGVRIVTEDEFIRMLGTSQEEEKKPEESQPDLF